MIVYRTQNMYMYLYSHIDIRYTTATINTFAHVDRNSVTVDGSSSYDVLKYCIALSTKFFFIIKKETTKSNKKISVSSVCFSFDPTITTDKVLCVYAYMCYVHLFYMPEKKTIWIFWEIFIVFITVEIFVANQFSVFKIQVYKNLWK